MKPGLKPSDKSATEGTLTNRAAAYIKLKKYKQALQDSEHALLLNPNFAKAHVRAYLCYVQVGNFEKAETALNEAIRLGDESSRTNLVQIGELLSYEQNARKAVADKKWSEAKYLYRSILNKASDSCKHTCLLMEAMVLENPRDLTDPISFSTKVQG